MDSPHKPKETPRAAAAFADYVSLGPSRSLAKLIEALSGHPPSLHQSATNQAP